MKEKTLTSSINKTYFIYFISMLLFVVVRVLVSEGLLKFSSNALVESVIFSIITQLSLMLLLPLLLYCLLFKSPPKAVFEKCNFKKTRWDIILICVLFGVIAFVFNMMISSFFNNILAFFGYQGVVRSSPATYSLAHFVIDIILVAVMPAICEEFLHRGLLLQGAKKMGYKKAILFSSVLFGLIHINIEQFFYASILGGFLATIVVATKNIWPAIIIHFVNNAIIVFLRGAKAFGWWGGNYSEVLINYFNNMNMVAFINLMIIVFLLVTTALILLVYLLHKRTVVREVEVDFFKAHNRKIKISALAPALTIKQLNNDIHAKKFVEDSSINLDYTNMRSIIDIVLPKEQPHYKMHLRDKVFLLAALFLGTLTTVFTFIWGLL